MPVDPARIPLELRERAQWVLARLASRDGRWTKQPYQLDGTLAATDDPTSWATFTDVLATYEAGGWDGIGYVFAADDPYVGIDIDKVRGNPEREAWALGIAERFGSYTEWSLSGAGLHIIGKGRMPDVGTAEQPGRNDQKKGLEAYSRRRFFTFTGRVVESAPTQVIPCQDALDWLLANEFTSQASERAIVHIDRATSVSLTGGDEELLRRMFRGKRGDQLERLYAGDASDYCKADGSPDLSGADLSLLGALAFYTSNNAGWMDRLYRGSGLARPKWDERHYADGRSYGEGTIGAAIAGCTTTYREATRFPTPAPKIQAPDRQDDSHSGGDGPGTCETAYQDDDELEQLRAEVLRLRRRALDQDDRIEHLASVVEAQQAIIRAQREQHREQLAERGALLEVIANPDLRGNEKIVAIMTAVKAHAQLDLGAGAASFSLGAIADVAGVSSDTVSKVGNRLSAAEAAPFTWTTTREKIITQDGSETWVSTLTVQPHAETLVDTFRTLAQYRVDRPKHGGFRERACPQHPMADVVITTTWRCSVCQTLLDTHVTGLPGQEPQLAVSEPHSSPPVVVRSLEPQVAVSDQLPLPVAAGRHGSHGTNGHQNGNGHAVRAAAAVLEATPVLTPKPAPWRCPSLECGSYERSGSRCDGCGVEAIS